MTDTLENTYLADLVDEERMLALHLIAELAPAGSYRPFGAASVAVVSGAGTATANGIIWSDFEPDDQSLADAIAAFPHIAAPWGVQVRGRVSEAVREITGRAGLAVEMTLPTMALPLAEWTPDLRASAPVERIEPAEADALARAIAAGMGGTLAESAPYASRALLERPEVLAVGVRTPEGEFASVGLSITATPSLVGLYAITTVPPLRRQGLGLAVTQSLLTAAQANGTAMAYLQSSPTARSLYAKIGFDTVEELTYLK
ncbi:GNAT family N-acetyltransferase [Microbacterium sp. P04]|uniref:GNAT family N-acetyltransferase n=1 Tax=Microbacterium sp. P04 TaxID=3366947 RepID=UPI003745D626